MNGCCDMCERCDFLYQFAVEGRHTLYLCHKCLYELRTDGDRYPENDLEDEE